MFDPFLSKQLPWQGQFHCFSMGFHCTHKAVPAVLSLAHYQNNGSCLPWAVLPRGVGQSLGVAADLGRSDSCSQVLVVHDEQLVYSYVGGGGVTTLL